MHFNATLILVAIKNLNSPRWFQLNFPNMVRFCIESIPDTLAGNECPRVFIINSDSRTFWDVQINVFKQVTQFALVNLHTHYLLVLPVMRAY